MMKTYEFTIIASGLDTEADDFEDHFYGAKCDDATVAVIKGKIVLEFAREARNFAHALASAIIDVRRAGAKIERIEPDYLVSLSDIAQRSDLSRSAISHYAAGNRDNRHAPVGLGSRCQMDVSTAETFAGDSGCR